MTSQRRNLITGITGFAGRCLAQLLLAHQEPVYGIARRSATLPGVTLLHADLSQPAVLAELLQQICPTHIYHLAGYTHAGRSFKEPQAAWEGNLTLTLHLLSAMQKYAPEARLLWVGSGLVYGQPLQPHTPVDEQTLLRPDTPYAASKAAADLAAFAAWKSSGLAIVRARPFNHTGPGQSAEFAIPSFARQLVAIERGQSPPVLEVGDLQSYRDMSDVRDVVQAYKALMDKGQPGEVYNVASGVSRSMRAILDEMVALTGVSIEVRTRADLLRPSEQTIIHVDTRKIQTEIGWKPQFSFSQTLADTLNAWRALGDHP
ncbi:MAG: GDP-mannose 4,6-dehydratase [Gemmataceae bacterium]